MAKFTATIQLHDAEKKDYDRLHTELEKQSFKGDKISPVKSKVDLTPREYNREGNITLQEVSSLIGKAASKTGKVYSFTVMKNKHVYN